MPMPRGEPGTAGRAAGILSFWADLEHVFGFLGLQFGFAAQKRNVSRIFQTLGAGLEQIQCVYCGYFTGLLCSR